MMTMKMPLSLLSLFLLVSPATGEEGTPSALPPQLETLKANYEAAVARATTPLTDTYLRELDKLKAEYTKAGNLEAALEVDKILQSLKSPSPAGKADFQGLTLSQMSLDQFKAWLGTVTIVERDSPYLNRYRFVDGQIVSTRGDSDKEREHENASVAVGKLFVPFTSTNATITFNESLTKAEISYSTGGKFEGEITVKE